MNPQNSAAARRRLSILLADDDRDTIAMLTAILLDERHVVHAVYRGDEVPDAVKRYNPDVCILDIDLPGRSGYSLAQELSTTGHPQRPILIAISGKYTRTSERLLAQTVGFDQFFTKPADPEQLVQCLEEIANGSNAVR